MSVKIAELVRVLDRGGIESFVINNISAMNKSLFDIDFILTRRRQEIYDDLIKKMNCKKKIVEINYSLNKLALSCHFFYSFYIFFRKNRYDVIHCHSIPPGISWASILLAARISGQKNIILHAHTAVPIDDIRGLDRIKWIIGRKLTSMYATCLAACSDEAAQYAFSPSEIKKKGYFIIKNGIETKRFAYDLQARNLCRAKLGMDDKYVIGCVARRTYLKNYLFMIDILEELLRIRKDALLLMVGGVAEGEEEYDREIMKVIKNKGLEKNVVMLEETSNPQDIMNALDVYLMPSLREGFSFSGVEAQCTGVKILASDRITPTMKLTDNWLIIPLEKGAKKWAEIANDCNNGYERKDCSELIKRQGYDIENTSLELKKLYIESANIKEA